MDMTWNQWQIDLQIASFIRNARCGRDAGSNRRSGRGRFAQIFCLDVFLWEGGDETVRRATIFSTNLRYCLCAGRNGNSKLLNYPLGASYEHSVSDENGGCCHWEAAIVTRARVLAEVKGKPFETFCR
jgi:hypothetical protein